MLKSILFTSIFLISGLSWAATDYEAELIKFVGKLNSTFALKIKTQKRDVCGFAANTSAIAYCQKDLDVFKRLGTNEKPLESLYTIIGHEYAHILLDYDKSPEAQSVYQESLKASLEQSLKIVEHDVIRIGQVEQSVYRSRSTTLERKVSDFIELIQHENIDALGAKLVVLLGYEPNPKSSELMIHFEESQNNPVYRTWIAPRKNIIQIAKDDGLDSWSNFHCLGEAFTYLDSNTILRNALARLGQDGFLRDLNRGCSVEESVETFFERLDFYYPSAHLIR